MQQTQGNLTTVLEVMEFMSPYAGGSVPSVGSEEWNEWIRWIHLGQQDAAQRGYWHRLFIPETITITSGESTLSLPDNFHKRNSIRHLFVGDVDWSARDNEDGVSLMTFIDPTTAVWKLRIYPTPTETTTGELWYYFNPPKPTLGADPMFLDGEMVGFYALKEYFRKLKKTGSMDDAERAYENRFNELLGIEMMTGEQETNIVKSYIANEQTPIAIREER